MKVRIFWFRFVPDNALTRMNKGVTLKDDGHFFRFIVKVEHKKLLKTHNLKLDKSSTWFCHSWAAPGWPLSFSFSHELGGILQTHDASFSLKRFEILRNESTMASVGCTGLTHPTNQKNRVHLLGIIDGRSPERRLLHIYKPPVWTWDI